MGLRDIFRKPGGRQVEIEKQMRAKLSETDDIADRFGIAVADGMRDRSPAQLRRSVPGLEEAGPLPSGSGDRWSSVALAASRRAREFIDNPRTFAPAVGEAIPADPYWLPQPLARAARERSVAEAIEVWKPSQRIDYVLHHQNERVAWRTGKMLAFGVEHEDNLETQARFLMERPDLAQERFSTLGEYLDKDEMLPDDPAKRIGWIRGVLGIETAISRSGLLGPRHTVDMAMTPAMDFHDEDRRPDGMGRLIPDYRTAALMGQSDRGKVQLLLITSSSRSRPIPACRENAEIDPTPQVELPKRGGLRVVGGLAMQAANSRGI